VTAAEGFDHPVLEIEATTREGVGASTETRLSFGAPTQLDGATGYYARAGGLDATFFATGASVDAVIGALSGPP
jgi:hypothetical protein